MAYGCNRTMDLGAERVSPGRRGAGGIRRAHAPGMGSDPQHPGVQALPRLRLFTRTPAVEADNAAGVIRPTPVPPSANLPHIPGVRHVPHPNRPASTANAGATPTTTASRCCLPTLPGHNTSPPKPRPSAGAGGCWLGIEHVGSTAVPGLTPPIIDIPPAAAARPRSAAAGSPLEGLGYQFWRENPNTQRMFFVRACRPSAMAAPTMSMSCPWPRPTATCCSATGCATTPTTPASYAETKHTLARRYPTDREAYTRGKDEVVARILGRALAATRHPMIQSGLVRGEREMHARELRETLVAGGNRRQAAPPIQPISSCCAAG